MQSQQFATDLKRGHEGEILFHSLFPHLERLDGRAADFKIPKTAETVELKTDYYDHNQTDNFFIERYSHGVSDGGPWQAFNKGVTYWVYFFPSSGHFYIFNTELLVRFLNWKFSDSEFIEIQNNGYVTRGFKVQRSLLEHLLVSPMELMKAGVSK